jgi:pilus assembly protein Flp/PilA
MDWGFFCFRATSPAGQKIFALPPCCRFYAVEFILQKPGFLDVACGLEQWECSMRLSITRFILDESGATAIEYALVASTISIAILAAVDKLGTQLNITFSTVWTALK